LNRNSQKKITIAVVVALCSFSLLSFVFIKLHFYDPRSPWGHTIRLFHGEWGGKQTVDDLADDLRQTSFVSNAQAWSIQTMQRFTEGKLITHAYSAPWSPVVALETNEIPDFIRNKWEGDLDYEICLSNGFAESFVIDWGSHGIVIGPTNFTIINSRWDGHYHVPVQPGVYVVWYDDK